MNRLLFWIGAALLAGSIVSCATTNDPLNPEPERGRSFIHVLNVNEQVDRLELRLSAFGKQTVVAQNLGFRESWPEAGYASLITGGGSDSLSNRQLLLLSQDSLQPLVAPLKLNFVADLRNTLILFDSLGKPLATRIPDDYEPAPGGRSNLRFINLSYVNLSVSLLAANDSVKIDRMNFANYSPFQSVPSDRYTLYFVNDFTGAKIDSLPGVRLNSRQSYYVYLTQKDGVPVGGIKTLEP
jgi:hypothetical protein